MTHKSAALVCSGGGALGVVLLGIVQALEEKGYTFDFYAGVSAGAIITSLHAAGLPAADIWKLIQDTNLFRIAFDFSPKNFGFLTGKKFCDVLEKALPVQDFSELKAPLWIGTTNFSNGDRVMINEGSIIQAVRASISVPVIFDPVWHEGEQAWLVDGGLSQNFPLDTAIAHYQGKRIFGLDIASGIHQEVNFGAKSPFRKNIKDTIGRTFKIFFSNQQNDFPEDKRVSIIAPTMPQFNSTDIFKLKDMYQFGLKYGRSLDHI